MCTGNPTEMLNLARARLTPHQWAKFEADFEHFCAYSGLTEMQLGGSWDRLSCESQMAVWVGMDYWRGVTEESK